MRLDALVALLTTIILFVVIPLRDTIRLAPATLGLMISYLILMSGTLQWAVRQSTELENLMVSVERVQEYTQLPPEGSFETETNPDADWPQEGKVEFVDMSLSYPNANSPDSPGRLSLKNISIVFEKGQKVGIVGRTGAGKSSLLQALFRLFEPAPKRSVIIDGLYTSDLGLTVLRSKIAIIPQDPFCFKGTIRFNLDPFSAYSDEDLWRTLEAVELKSAIENEPKKLDATVEENGSNWSIGERQLMCLARAILKNARLIVMDEATSSIDIKTDQLIQKAIRTQGGLFQNSTVLCIAHR
jgi:ATP-binding cassette subfamily C (CFTR/MRP) protein 4